jgi:hypothetical protein
MRDIVTDGTAPTRRGSVAATSKAGPDANYSIAAGVTTYENVLRAVRMLVNSRKTPP